jgi:hypothetical protein
MDTDGGLPDMVRARVGDALAASQPAVALLKDCLLRHGGGGGPESAAALMVGERRTPSSSSPACPPAGLRAAHLAAAWGGGVGLSLLAASPSLPLLPLCLGGEDRGGEGAGEGSEGRMACPV